MVDVPPEVRPPSTDEIRMMAARHDLALTDDEVELFAEFARGRLEFCETLLELDDPFQPPDDRRCRRPGEDEDPFNAFVTRCDVQEADDGPLAGLSVGVKDCVAVAGIEMTCGSPVLEGYVPDRDATIVTRILAAGGRLTGKTNMDEMACSGLGISATGPVRNPRDHDHLAGGSSGGSAVAVITGEVDVAVGGDQGGSIRIPASWSGCVGFKPTFGRVPYTGAVGRDVTRDHLGPMGTSVADCRTLLGVLEGDDPADPRQPTRADSGERKDPSGTADLRVGVVAEGFGHDHSEAGVDRTVEDALAAFDEHVGTVESTSVPMHADSFTVMRGIALEGTVALYRDEAVGRYGRGFYDATLAAEFGERRRERAADLPLTDKLRLVLGEHLDETTHGYYYAKAMNLAFALTDAYDAALEEYDVLAMPTTPNTAAPVLEDGDPEAYVRQAKNMAVNTGAASVTGHPAISVPCGATDGLPVGLMFVGRRGRDRTVLRAGEAFEVAVDVELPPVAEP